MRLLLLLLIFSGALAATAVASTSHDGWPEINGVLLMNKNDSPRPLDARPGHDPFDGKDATYSCDEVHVTGSCQQHFVGSGAPDPGPGDATDPTDPASRRGERDRNARGVGNGGPMVVRSEQVHNELLGGHGSDTIHAGPSGDVLWGDYKPSGQPTSQRDVIVGGAGRDFIYASHGTNVIDAGPGNDWLKAHFGRGTINCGPGTDLLYISRRAQRSFTISNCEQISHKTLGR